MTDSKPLKTGWIIGLTSIGFFMAMMDSMIVTTASTAIRTDFQISVATLQWALNAYNITIAAVLMIGVSLGERFGRRKVYQLGILIFTLGSVACALATNITVLVIARIIEGIGASVMTPMSMAILSEALPTSERGKALGAWSALGGLALIVGPSLGGLIVAKLTWQWIFWINVPIGLITVYWSQRQLPESRGEANRVNIIDSLLMILAFAGFVWTLSALTTAKSWFLPVLIGVISLSCAGWLLLRQRRTVTPLVPWQYFQSVTFRGATVATFLLYAAMYGVVFFLPQFLQVVAGANALTAGLEILPWTGTLVIVAPFAGKAVDQYGEKVVATWGLLLQGIGYLVIGLVVSTQSSYLVMLVPLMIAGAGLSMAGPALQKAVLGVVTPADLGPASGVYNVSRLLGGAVGTALAVIIFSLFGSVETVRGFASGFRALMVAVGLISILGSYFSLRLGGEPVPE